MISYVQVAINSHPSPAFWINKSIHVFFSYFLWENFMELY